MEIGAYIKAERLKMGMTQRELGARTGIRQPVIVRIESGGPVTVTTLKRVAEGFGMELVITMKGKK